MSYIVSDINKYSNDLDKVQKIISGLNNEQQKLVISSSKLSVAERTKLELLLGETTVITENTTATIANTAATKNQTLSEEDALAKQWLSIGGTEADTTATNANTVAKKANLKVTNLLKVASQKLKASMLAHPLIAMASILGLITTGVIKLSKWFENAGNRAKEATEKAKEALDQTKSEIEQINSSLQTTQNRIDELNAKENLSLVESEELAKLKEANEELERELRIKEELAKTQGKEANDKAVKYFNTKTNHVEYSTGENGRMYVSDSNNYSLIDAVENKLAKIPEMKQSLKDLQKQLEEIEDTDPNYKNNSDWLNLKSNINRMETELSNYQEFVESSIADFMETDDSLVEGIDDGILERLGLIYQSYDELMNGTAKSHENIISATLDKVDFKNAKDELLELGKEGSLSVGLITSKFPELKQYLDEAGISAQELYQYIMNLANPDAIKYDELKRQMQDAMGFEEGSHAPWAIELDKQLKELGLYENDALEVFASIKAKYVNGETELWTVQDWIANIQEKLNSGTKIEEPVTFSSKLDSSQESLDKFQASIKSASDAYTTLLSGNYSSSELLSSIQTINQAVSDMNGELNWDFINNQADSLEVLGDAIQCVSRKYANSILSGAGIDINSDFEKMLSDMIQQAYEVEAEFAGMNAQIDNLQSSYQTLTSVIESYNETGYISLDSLQSLLTADENLISMLEVENGQLAINQAAYENLVAVQLMELKAKLSNAAAAEIEELAKQKAEEATNNNASASNNAVEKLDAETAAINRNTSAAISNAVAKAEEAGVSEEEIQGVLDKNNEVWNALLNNFSGDFSGFMGGGSKAAKSAGKEAADAYLESFEKELKDLDDLKDRGKITEKQYLDALRRLYLKYFRDKEKYLKEYEKYEHQYLDGMKSLYESAFSYITKQVGKRIDALNDEKDAAVSALEAERDARLEAIEAQKEQYENEIEGIEKQIDAKEKEIKAMQDANSERKRAIDLQGKEYNLQRMQNQKTANVYKGGQMGYEADTSGVRDAKQEVEDAKLEIDVSKIEKEIDLLEDEKGILQERIELLEKEAEQVNKYYDNLIKQTELHYDSMIKGMEDYKVQFEGLTDLLENAQLESTLAELGINMDALLNGSQEEFEKLKTAYIGILADMSRGNDGVLDQLSRLSGISTQSISYLDATKGAFEGLGDVALEGLESSVDGIGESVNALSTSAGEASTAVGKIQESVSSTSQSITPLNEELGNLKTLISGLTELLNNIKFPEIGDEGYAQKLRDIAQAFGEIASKCNEFKTIDFSSIIGSASVPSTDGAAMPGVDGMEGSAGTGFMGLASAISEAVASIDEQMGKLETALGKGNSHFKNQMSVINDEYLPAWESLQARLAEIIGVGGGNGDNKEGKGNQGEGGKEGGSGTGVDSGSIIGIMQTGGEEVAARLEDPWLKAFNDFATDGDNSIQTVCDKIIELVSEMARIIQEKCEAAASALNALAKTASSSLHSVGGSVSGNTIPSHAEGTVGDAFANGTEYKGLPHDEKNALRSEYGQAELTVYPDGETELTTEPTMSDLPKGTVIFNEEQTKKIMDNEGEKLGNAYAEGTVVTPDGHVLIPLAPDDPQYWMKKKFDAYFKENRDAFLIPTNAMLKAAESVDRVFETINNNNSYMKRDINVNIGDINLQGVQDVNSLSREIVLRMPNMLLQEMHKK